MTHIVPKVGMPVTYQIGSDQHGAMIKAVKRRGHTIVIDLNGYDEEFTKRKDGRYLQKGRDYGSLKLGEAVTKIDYSF